eukprot:TRINITY_DN11918_c0_g1_i1.p1 TRINITY_DN11918_c0_g1~~TRINITY_DN11918_c0_g1_i1.p1  ORF type:complete len:362 (-),score=104.93 TRINITY_DN11918_c0_g1_i1:263-1261(-)
MPRGGAASGGKVAKDGNGLKEAPSGEASSPSQPPVVARRSSGSGFGCLLVGVLLGVALCVVTVSGVLNEVVEDQKLLDAVAEIRKAAGTAPLASSASAASCPAAGRATDSEAAKAAAAEKKVVALEKEKAEIAKRQQQTEQRAITAEQKLAAAEKAATGTGGLQKALEEQTASAKKAADAWAKERAQLQSEKQQCEASRAEASSMAGATSEKAPEAPPQQLPSKAESAQVALDVLDSTEVKACDDGQCGHLKRALRMWKRAIDGLQAVSEGDSRVKQMETYIEQIVGYTTGLVNMGDSQADQLPELFATVAQNNRQVFEVLRGYLETVATMG